MEIFDKIGKKASEAYKMTADKTGKIAKETKLKLRMNELKSQVNDIYEEIGKKVYEKHVKEEDISIKQDLETECTKIDVLSDEIEELLQQCLELKDRKQCPKCYKEIDKEDNFCPNCGEKQVEETTKEVEVVEDDITDFDVEKEDIVEENNLDNDAEDTENDDEMTNLEKTVSIESDIDMEKDIQENNEEEDE